MGQIQSVDEFISFLRRRWMVIALCTFLGAVVSLFIALQREAVFEAVAVIRVEERTVNPENPGTADPSTSAAQVLQGIQQRLTSREHLSEVIDRHGLFSEVPGWSQDQKISALRGLIRIESIDSTAGQTYGQSRNIQAILVYARIGDAEMAARLANDFAQSILDQSASGQMEKAAENVAFFKEEEARLWGQISELEAEIAAFKNANSDALPGLQDASRNELSALDSDLRERSQEQVALQGQVQALKSKENLRETDRRQLDDWTSQLTVIQGQIDQTLARRAEVAATMARLPEVERVLSGYERQIAQLQGEYGLVTNRMAVAQTTQRLAERGQGEGLSLLERALQPEFPLGGGRKKIAMAGTMAAMMAGLVLAFVMELARPVVRTSQQMQRQLGIRPVVTIPELAPKQRHRLLAGLPKLIEDPLNLAANLPRPVVIAIGFGLVGVLTAIVA